MLLRVDIQYLWVEAQKMEQGTVNLYVCVKGIRLNRIIAVGLL